MGKLRTAIAQKMVKRFAAARTATDIDKSASVSVILGIAGIATLLLSLILSVYIIATSTTVGLGVFFVGVPLSLLFIIAALLKSNNVKTSPDATQNQKAKAKKGFKLGIIGVGLFVIAAILFRGIFRKA
jgi:hypothetical protein